MIDGNACFAYFNKSWGIRKEREFDRLRINRLASDSEWSRCPIPAEIYLYAPRTDYAFSRECPTHSHPIARYLSM